MLAEPLVLSYALAIVASVLLGLTVTPALTVVLGPGHADQRHERLVGQRIRHGYRRLAGPVLRRPGTAVALAATAALGAALLVPTFGQQILPAFHDPDLVSRWTGPSGMSEPETARLVTRASRDLRAIPGVRRRRRPHRPGRARRPRRRRQLGRVLGQRRSVRRLQRDRSRPCRTPSRLPGDCPRRQLVPQRPGHAVRHRAPRRHPGAGVRARVQTPGAARRRGAEDAVGDRRGADAPASTAGSTSRTSRSRSTSQKAKPTVSSPATCAVPRRPCWRGSRWAASSSSRRCSRSRCGAHRTAGRT